jgi:hypothetical protein
MRIPSADVWMYERVPGDRDAGGLGSQEASRVRRAVASGGGGGGQSVTSLVTIGPARLHGCRRPRIMLGVVVLRNNREEIE